MSFTSYGTCENIVSNWPAGISLPNSAKYIQSVSNAYQIDALSHVHVIDIDISPGPNTMTLTLPIQKNLPLGSRIYFFYVSQSTYLDVATFIPVAGSGNTVNGNALGFSFILSGSPELIICLGVNDNYIMQAIGKNNPAKVSYRSGIQSKMVNFVSPTPGSGLMTNFYGTTTGLKSMFYPNANAMDVFVPFGDENISNYVTRNVAVPTKGVYGFQVNVAGWYEVKLSLEAGIQWDSTAGQNVWADLAVCNAAGTLTQHWRSADCCQSYYIGSSNYPVIMTSQFVNFDAGDFLIFSYSGIGASIVSTTYSSAAVSFVYYGPTNTSPPAPLPTTFEAFSQIESVISSNTDPEVFAPLSKSIAGKKAASLQKTLQPPTLLSLSKKAEEPQQPKFSLSDMERMINQALDARASSLQLQKSVPSIGEVEPSESSSSSSSSSAPPSKKRKAV